MVYKNTIVYENTLYSLFLFIITHDDWNNYHYVFFEDRIEKNFLRKFEKKVVKLDFLDSSLISVAKNPFLFYIKRIKEILKYRRINYVIGNANSYLNPFCKVKRLVVEDGFGTSFELEKLARGIYPRNIKSVILLKQSPFYKGPDSYLLSDSYSIPVNLTNYVDVDIVNIEKKWNMLSESNQSNIMKLFGVTYQLIGEMSSRKIILLTQPLSEDGYLTEEDKVTGYKNLIKNLGINEAELIIKTHPRESTSYKEFFKNSIVVNDKFPFEIASLLGIKYKTLITAYSSSVFNVNYDANIIFTGTAKIFNWKNNVVIIDKKISLIDDIDCSFI